MFPCTSSVIKSPKSDALPVDAIVTNSITFELLTALGEYLDPPYIPLVLSEDPIQFCQLLKVSPKSFVPPSEDIII